MSKKINYSVSTGTEYELAFGTVNIVIGPGMLGKMKRAIEKAESWQKRFSNITPEKLETAENEMRELFNEAFGTDICSPAFGEMSLFSVTDSGKLLFEEFFDAFIPELESELRKAKANMTAKAISPAAKKYLPEEGAKKPIAAFAKPYDRGLPDVSGLSQEEKKLLALQLLS